MIENKEVIYAFKSENKYYLPLTGMKSIQLAIDLFNIIPHKYKLESARNIEKAFKQNYLLKGDILSFDNWDVNYYINNDILKILESDENMVKDPVFGKILYFCEVFEQMGNRTRPLINEVKSAINSINITNWEAGIDRLKKVFIDKIIPIVRTEPGSSGHGITYALPNINLIEDKLLGNITGISTRNKNEYLYLDIAELYVRNKCDVSKSMEDNIKAIYRRINTFSIDTQMHLYKCEFSAKAIKGEANFITSILNSNQVANYLEDDIKPLSDITTDIDSAHSFKCIIDESIVELKKDISFQENECLPSENLEFSKLDDRDEIIKALDNLDYTFLHIVLKNNAPIHVGDLLFIQHNVDNIELYHYYVSKINSPVYVGYFREDNRYVILRKNSKGRVMVKLIKDMGKYNISLNNKMFIKYIKKSETVFAENVDICKEGVEIASNGEVKFTFSKKKLYMDQYQENHRMLVANYKNKNFEGMKYNLAYLFTMISNIENIMHNDSKNFTDDMKKARAFAINDFKTYLNNLHRFDTTFDFHKYYRDNNFDKYIVTISPENVRGFKKLLGSILY